MNCITLFLPPMTMATTQLASAIQDEENFSSAVEPKAERKSLRMSWVVVTDECGRRQLRMHWVAVADR
jgi:hypothetical protein